jgi:hypothetical protein
MGASKKTWMVLMENEMYCNFPTNVRMNFIESEALYDDYDLYKNDDVFQKLYKAKKKASKELREWKFNQRNKC